MTKPAPRRAPPDLQVQLDATTVVARGLCEALEAASGGSGLDPTRCAAFASEARARLRGAPSEPDPAEARSGDSEGAPAVAEGEA